jgi:hypothetical protein
MEIRHAEAELGVDCKAAVGRAHGYAGRLEGVGGRESQPAPVHTTLKVRAWRA